jgi:hypothetical protein
MTLWQMHSGATAALELFWFETTDREDLGRDLNAPQFGEEGHPHWSYDFVTVVEQGDIVVQFG